VSPFVITVRLRRRRQIATRARKPAESLDKPGCAVVLDRIVSMVDDPERAAFERMI
jgi:hypothetical protein